MNPTQQTLELLKVINAQGGLARLDAGELAKAGITISTGLVAYDLEPVAALMVPGLTLTPLVKSIPRVGGGIGSAINYKQITKLALTSLGQAEGKRAGIMGLTVVDKLAAYKRLGQETFVTVDAEESSLPGTDNRALAALALLNGLINRTEPVFLGGNTSLALTTTPTPVLADVAPAAGQSFKAKTKYTVNCVALTLEGFLNSSVALGIATIEHRTNGDGTTDNIGGGSAQVSLPADQTTGDDANDTHGIKASVTPVNGAVAYAWFWGLNGGDIKLGAITTINSIFLTSPTPAGTQKVADLPASDNSQNALIFDGLITQICSPNSQSYLKVMPNGTLGTGTPLTYDGAGGIVEINDACQAFWDNWKLSPDVIYGNTQELKNISNKVIAGGGEPLFQFIVDMNNPNAAAITAGRRVGYMTNKIAGGPPIELINHPNLPAGCLVFRCTQVPYALPGVANILEYKYIRDYYQIDWPQTTMSYYVGVSTRGVLLNRFTQAIGMIINIGNG